MGAIDHAEERVRSAFDNMMVDLTVLALTFINNVVKTPASFNVQEKLKEFIDDARKAAKEPVEKLLKTLGEKAKEILGLNSDASPPLIKKTAKDPGVDDKEVTVSLAQSGEVRFKWQGVESTLSAGALNEYTDREKVKDSTPSLQDSYLTTTTSEGQKVNVSKNQPVTTVAIKDKVDEYDKAEEHIQKVAEGIAKCCKKSQGCFVAGTIIHLPVGKKPIEELAVGSRVISCRCENNHSPCMQSAPAFLRLIKLHLALPAGDVCQIELLRSVHWLESSRATSGSAISLTIPELGVEGPAHIVAVCPCPDIEDGDGRLVTGTFRYGNAQTWELLLEHGAPIRCTPSHPFWSLDRNAWIPMEELRCGERLDSLKGVIQVRRVRPDVVQRPVYNIEVDVDHCYRVGDLGILVHNASSATASDIAKVRDYAAQLREDYEAAGFEPDEITGKAAIAIYKPDRSKYAFGESGEALKNPEPPIMAGLKNLHIQTQLGIVSCDNPAGGCAEVHAANSLLKLLPGDAERKLCNILIVTVSIRSGDLWPPCPNCTTTLEEVEFYPES